MILPDFYYGFGVAPDFSKNWRTFRVRSGLVLTSIVTTGSMVMGTDLSVYPQLNIIPPFSTGIDVTIPVNTPKYWFWINNQMPTASLAYGANPITPDYGSAWSSFPTASANSIPIGYVDTLTSSSFNMALVNQYLTTNIFAAGGGTSLTLTNYITGSTYSPSQLVYVQPWDSASLNGVYNYNSMVGNTASVAIKTSMPGTYLCIAATSPRLNTTSGSIFSGSYGFDIPTNPPINNSWEIVSPWPEQHYVITSLINNDYYYGRTYTVSGSNILTGSINIPIAKSARLRTYKTNAFETIDGVNITYATTTSGSADNFRLASDGVNHELQTVFPRYTAYPMTSSAYNKTVDMSIITAYTPLTGTDVIVSSSVSQSVYLEEMLPHRVWAKRYIQ